MGSIAKSLTEDDMNTIEPKDDVFRGPEKNDDDFERFRESYFGDDNPYDFENKKSHMVLESVQLYKYQIRRYRPLSQEEEISVVKWIDDGYRGAEEILYVANLSNVVNVAQEYAFTGIPLADLIQEGNIGLHIAIGKYDYTKNKRFITYADYYIRKAIRAFITDQTGAFTIPDNIVGQINEVKYKELELIKKLGRQPTDKEIAEGLNKMLNMTEDRISHLKALAMESERSKFSTISKEEIKLINLIKKQEDKLSEKLGRLPSDKEIAEAIIASRKHKIPQMTEERVRELKNLRASSVSLNAPFGDDEDEQNERVNQLEAPKSVAEDDSDRNEKVKRIHESLKSLDDRERKIIMLRFGISLGKEARTVQDISKELNVSVERIDQIIEGAKRQMLRKLKNVDDSNDIVEVDYI